MLNSRERHGCADEADKVGITSYAWTKHLVGELWLLFMQRLTLLLFLPSADSQLTCT